jgi:hypothetical protein
MDPRAVVCLVWPSLGATDEPGAISDLRRLKRGLKADMGVSAEEQSGDPLERLERETARLAALLKQTKNEVRNLQWLIAGAVVLASGALFYLHEAGVLKIKSGSHDVEKTVESQEFGLYNRTGDRVVLGDYDKFGYPNLVFMDLKKNYRMGIKVWPEGGGTPGMVFYDDTGIRGNWRMDENNGTALNLMGRGQKGKISLGVTAEGDPSVTVTNKEGRVIFAVPEMAEQAKPSSSQPSSPSDRGSQYRPTK